MKKNQVFDFKPETIERARNYSADKLDLLNNIFLLKIAELELKIESLQKDKK